MTNPRLNLVRIDLAAIRGNAAVLVERSEDGALVPDLRVDAFGHGRRQVLDAAIAGGATVPREGSLSSPGCGPALYGITDDDGLVPAMRVSSVVVAIKTVEAGDGVSYGYTYRAARRTNLALISIGYADGLSRSASNRGTLLLRGVARRIAGRVAMNALVLDLGDEQAAVGDEAIVFGDDARGEPTARAWAQSIGSTASEVVTVFGTHLPRVYR